MGLGPASGATFLTPSLVGVFGPRIQMDRQTVGIQMDRQTVGTLILHSLPDLGEVRPVRFRWPWRTYPQGILKAGVGNPPIWHSVGKYVRRWVKKCMGRYGRQAGLGLGAARKAAGQK